MPLSHDAVPALLPHPATRNVAGQGPAVALLHSTVGDRRMWDAQVAALTAAGYQTVRMDLRGYGDTPAPDQPYDNAADVVEVLDHLDIRSFALVGASGGGRVTLEVAARWPARVTRLALLCTAAADHEPSTRLASLGDEEDRLLEAGDIDGATELNVRTWLGPLADDAARDLVRRMQRHAFEVQLAAADVDRVRVPHDVTAVTATTLLVSGEHDLPDFQEIAATLAGQIPDARHVHLDWAGHLPNLEQPEAINTILLDFLRR